MKHLRRSLVALAAIALTMTGTAALADTVTIAPAKDNTLYENSGGLLSNGQGSWIFTGRTGTGSIRRALLEFDVAAGVPAGATIDSVTLTLSMDQTIVGDVTNTLHRVSTEWGEGASDAGGQEGTGGPAQAGDATWLHTFFDTDFWAAAGGDFNAAASGSAIVGAPGSYTFGSSAQMVADVQSWLDNPAGNAGWVVRGDESVFPTAKRFSSQQGAAPPSLTIVFTPDVVDPPDPSGVPTVGEWGLILMSLLFLTAGTLLFGRRAATAGGAGTASLGGGQPLFVPHVFLKALAVTLALVTVGFVASIALLGELTAVDITGSLMCAPIFAYMIHLWAMSRK